MTEDSPQYVPDPVDDPVDLAAETMTGDLLSALLDEFKAAPDVWPKLSEHAQDCIIDRFHRRVGSAIDEAVRMIASDNRKPIRASLESFTAKEGIKAVLTVARHDPQRHELMDAVGKQVLVIVADATAYAGGDRPQAERQQRTLPIDGAVPVTTDADATPAADDADPAALAALEDGLEDGAPDLGEEPEPTDEAAAEPAPWERSNGRIYDAILLIPAEWTGFTSEDDDANLQTIAGWSDEQAQAVEVFCGEVAKLEAGELDDIRQLPVRPTAIGGPLPLPPGDDELPEPDADTEAERAREEAEDEADAHDAGTDDGNDDAPLL